MIKFIRNDKVVIPKSKLKYFTTNIPAPDEYKQVFDFEKISTMWTSLYIPILNTNSVVTVELLHSPNSDYVICSVKQPLDTNKLNKLNEILKEI